MNIEYPDKKINTKELLPQIVERIFSICKTDDNFPLKQKMTTLDEQSSSIQHQFKKQERLIQQSKALNNNLVERLTNLQQSNQELRDRLLDSLGSEL